MTQPATGDFQGTRHIWGHLACKMPLESAPLKISTRGCRSSELKSSAPSKEVRQSHCSTGIRLGWDTRALDLAWVFLPIIPIGIVVQILPQATPVASATTEPKFAVATRSRSSFRPNWVHFDFADGETERACLQAPVRDSQAQLVLMLSADWDDLVSSHDCVVVSALFTWISQHHGPSMQ
jgi:hypothetical protein